MVHKTESICSLALNRKSLRNPGLIPESSSYPLCLTAVFLVEYWYTISIWTKLAGTKWVGRVVLAQLSFALQMRRLNAEKLKVKSKVSLSWVWTHTHPMFYFLCSGLQSWNMFLIPTHSGWVLTCNTCVHTSSHLHPSVGALAHTTPPPTHSGFCNMPTHSACT